MNPNHLAALWFNEWARNAWLWSRYSDQWSVWADSAALALWGM
jgi:hypothetical protein